MATPVCTHIHTAVTIQKMTRDCVTTMLNWWWPCVYSKNLPGLSVTALPLL